MCTIRAEHRSATVPLQPLSVSSKIKCIYTKYYVIFIHLSCKSSKCSCACSEIFCVCIQLAWMCSECECYSSSMHLSCTSSKRSCARNDIYFVCIQLAWMCSECECSTESSMRDANAVWIQAQHKRLLAQLCISHALPTTKRHSLRF